MPRDAYSKLRKELEKRRSKIKSESEEITTWRKKWRKLGPVRFAEEVLTCPREVPPHPDLGYVPEFVILTEEQKEFLIDLWKRNVTQMILAAGRGAGKTFCIAIYVTWRICCFDYFTMTVMGGSGEQSTKIKDYVDDWRRDVDEIFYCLYRSVAGGNKPAQVHSRWSAYARFPACSDTAARGPHVTQLMIDEVCVGEAKGRGGAKAVRSARGQLTSSPRSILVYTSTAHYIFGTFYKTWRNYRKLGFKRYRWSIAKHINYKWLNKDGTKNWDLIDTVLYKDRKATNWVSNVWWVTTEDIQNFRKNMTDDEFLVEVLGGISRGSGLVFGRDDLRGCICKGDKYTDDGEECEECLPYTDDCPAMTKHPAFKDVKGSAKSKLASISNRKCGVDFGDVSPNACTINGRRKEYVFTLYSDERTGLRTEEIIDWIDDICKKWNVREIFADPEERAMKEQLEDKEYNTPHIWAMGGGAKKAFYITKYKRWIENKKKFIPKRFDFLTTSLIELAYDDRSKIRKHNDHSFDSDLYSMIDFDPGTDDTDFWAIKNRQLDIW